MGHGVHMRACAVLPAEECSFAHGAEEVRTVSLAEREALGLLPSAASFKTVVCWNWLTTGAASRPWACHGARLLFAHDHPALDRRALRALCRYLPL
jgi:hypothetical protein